MTFSRFVMSVVTVAMVVCVVAGSVRADSLLAQHSANGGRLEATLTAGFNDPNGTSVPGTDFQTDGPHSDQTDASLSPIASAAATLTTFPVGVSDPTDIAEGTLTVDFEYGSPVLGSSVADDTLEFSIDATLSALDAHNSVGAESDTFVNAKGTFDFFLDPGFGGAPTGALVGQLDLPALRALDPFELVLSLMVTQDSSLVASLFAGDAASSVDLFSGSAYLVTYQFAALVPFGFDPHFTTLDGLRFTPAAIRVIPAPPAAVGAVPCGLLLLRRRR